MGILWAPVVLCYALWGVSCNEYPDKLLINSNFKTHRHTHNDGVPCSNQGAATIFRLLRAPIVALDLTARRSCTSLYCFCHRSKIRFALSGGKFHSIDRGVETFSESLSYVCVLLAVSLMFALRSTHSRRQKNSGCRKTQACYGQSLLLGFRDLINFGQI